MWRPIIVVAALCGSAQAFFPEWAIDKAFEKAYGELNVAMPEAVQEQPLSVGARLMQLIQGRPAPHHGPDRRHCMYCVGATTHHIMGAVIGHLKELCEETKCPFLKKKCEMAKEHPGVAYGFLLDHTHAMEKSVAYCYGRGACPHPGSERPHCQCHHGGHGEGNNAAVDDDNISMEMEFVTHMRNRDFGSSPRVMGKTMMVLANEEAGNQTCAECIEGTAKCVTEGAVHAITEWCEKTECECAKRMCKWAEEHKDVALGVLVSRLRPGEWGCGYCFGNGTCKMPEKPEEEKEKPHVDMREVVRRGLNAW